MKDLTKYNEVKDRMKTGDLLQWKSNSIIGSLIRCRTARSLPEGWPAVNHSSLVIRLSEYEGLERRRFTQEALEHGVVLNLLSRRLEAFDGEVWWYPLKEEFNGVRQVMGELALAYTGVPYDYGSLFRQILGKVSADARSLFCSELCCIIYGYTGKMLSPAEMPELGMFEEKVKL